MKFSLFASSVRPHLWKEFFDSLKSNKVDYEVVFCGNCTPAELKQYPKFDKLKYIHVGNIKPAQCYEIARRECKGELINWTADDCEYSEGALDKIYAFWKSLDNRKALISVKTNENNTNNDLNDHRFFGFNVNTPLMAPLGVMDREYLEELGGYDRRYVNGQTENDVAMRVYADGGTVVKFEEVCIDIEHQRKHGNSTKFWESYDHDRKVLENSWVVGGYQPSPDLLQIPGTRRLITQVANREVVFKRFDAFEPFEENSSWFVKSQGEKGIFE